MLNGVAVSAQGARVRELSALDFTRSSLGDGGEHPRAVSCLTPGERGTTGGGASSHDRIVSSHAVFADSSNRLWIVDDAGPRVAPAVPGAAEAGEHRTLPPTAFPASTP